MFIHQNIAVDQNYVKIIVILMDLKEFYRVLILQEDVLSFVSTAGDMI